VSQPVNLSKYNLVTGENTFASPASTDPADARRLQSLIPSVNGEMGRETPPIQLGALTLTDPTRQVRVFHEFRHHDGFGAFTTHFFAASNDSLYRTTSIFPTATWTKVLTLTDYPVLVNIDNTLHISDGTSSWIFDGTSIVQEGLQIPPNAPTISVTAGTGSSLILSNRYYRCTYVDDTATRNTHESSGTGISAGTGAVNVTGGQIIVYQEPGTITTVSGSPAIVGSGTSFSSRHVGMKLRTAAVTGVILTVTDATHLTLDTNAGSNTAAQHFTIAPQRATKWNIYGSGSEEDKLCFFLAQVDLGTFSYTDTSPMIGTSGSIFANINTPLRNDPPNATRVEDVFQRRIWRRNEQFPTFFTNSAYEEVLSQQAGYPYECVPGIDDNTASPDVIDENSYPDQSAEITCIRAHGDALFIGTEKNVIPLYGQSLADFSLSNVNAFSLGMAGRRLSISTPFGLVFFTYDKKLYLYPTQISQFATAYGGEQTTSLIELGRPKRDEFEQVDGNDFQTASLVFYNYGRRNWLVFSYRRKDQTYVTWVFDFEAKGWFQLQQGYLGIGVFEVTKGERVLVGATANDGNGHSSIVVIDDLTGTYTLPNANYPVGTYRQYTDFGKPGSYFLLKGVQYEVSDPTMVVNVAIWLDPSNPDNPGDPTIPSLNMTRKTIGAKTQSGAEIPSNRFHGTVSSDTGGTCQRVLVEFMVGASMVNGTLRGIKIDADELEADPVL